MEKYSYLADAVVVGHAVYVGFIVLGLLAILIGGFFGVGWIRNFYFRAIHLAMITIVAVEALLGVACPLTTLENHLRERAGQPLREGSFMGRAAHDLLFYEAPQWVFNSLHIGFALLVLATFILLPPALPWKKNERELARSAIH